MGYATHVGRVGALAVTLGVGFAMATTPGTAHADPTDASTTSPSAVDGSSTGKSTSVGEATDATEADADASDESDDDVTTDVTDDDVTTDETDADVTTDVTDDDVTTEETDADAITDGADTQTPPAADDDPAPPRATARDGSNYSLSGPTAERRASSQPASAQVPTPPAASAKSLTSNAEPVHRPEALRLNANAVNPPSVDGTAAIATALTSAVPAPAPPPRPVTLIRAVTEFVAAVLQPLLSPVEGSPIQFPILTAVLAAVRNEFERILAPRKATAAPSHTVALVADPPAPVVDPTAQHVLVIGVDGANLSRILADDYNENFAELMATSTTAASSIVGHTTISNPSWSAILTGQWGEKTGVINNVFTPWTYDRFPTVFNQLEALDPNIDTMTVANWNVINAISAAGAIPVDDNVYVAQIEGDTNWLATDDAVANQTVAAIAAADAPNFLFSYFVGVDENGHLYGGASEEYKLAIRNMDDNLGELLDAVAATGEDWTIIVLTDHGHQPQQGLGHGFQSPDETATFVIVDGPNFQDGYVNQAYEIVDTTPTVVSLFGGTPMAGSDGVSLTTLGGSDVDPADLEQALEDAIAQNESPDLITDVALALRTIFATVPYYVYLLGNDTRRPSELPGRAGADRLRRPVRGDQRPCAGRRLPYRCERRPTVPAAAAGSTRAPAGGPGDAAGVRDAGLRTSTRIARRVVVR